MVPEYLKAHTGRTTTVRPADRPELEAQPVPSPCAPPATFTGACEALSAGHNWILFVPRTEHAEFAKYLELKRGEVAERSKAAVLKTVVMRVTWGSNP